jgi:GST-like protein
VLTERAAIFISRGLSYPQAGLLHASEGERAPAIRGLLFMAANCYADVSMSNFPARWTGCASSDA